MKRVYSLILLAILAFNIAGVYIVFKFQQSRIRREIKSQIKSGVSDEELHQFVFSEDELGAMDWVRRNKEFVYEGKMYDIVYTEKDGGRIHFYCINDEEEEVLFAQLDILVTKQFGEEAKNTASPASKLIKLFNSLVYISPQNTFDLHKPNGPSCQNGSLATLYSSPFLSRTYPPPQLF